MPDNLWQTEQIVNTAGIGPSDKIMNMTRIWSEECLLIGHWEFVIVRNWDDFTQSCGIDIVWETDMLTITVTGRDYQDHREVVSSIKTIN